MYVKEWFANINEMLKVIYEKQPEVETSGTVGQHPPIFNHLFLFDQSHKNTLIYQVYSTKATFKFGEFISTGVGVTFLTGSMCPLFICTGLVG